MIPDYKLFSDHDLISRLGNGDRDAFTEIYNRYWKKLLTAAASKLKSVEDAEEIVQEIFIALWNRRASLEITAALSNYLAVCVKYHVIKVLDKNFNKQKYIDTLLADHLLDDSTQEWLRFQELKDQLSILIAELPEKCRVVYQLSRDANYSQKQIAEELQISEKTVEAHIGKAIRILRSKLASFFFTLL